MVAIREIIHIRVEPDESMFTGWKAIEDDGDGYPASRGEIALWKQYQSALVYLEAQTKKIAILEEIIRLCEQGQPTDELKQKAAAIRMLPMKTNGKKR